MTEIKDGTTSKQKAEYISHSLVKRGKGDYIELKYKRLDGDNPGAEMTTGAFITQLDESSKELIKGKGQFVVVKTKSGKFWNLTKIENVSTYVEKAKSSYTGGGMSNRTTPNTTGIKVGAVLHDAVALAGVGAKVSTVKTIAEELLSLSYELEANVNAGKYTPSATTINTTKTATATKAVIVEIDDSLDELENINF